MNLIKMTAVLLVLSLSILSCQSTDNYKKGKLQLKNMGYTNVKSQGYALFCCSENDIYSTHFTAKDKQGKTVEGCICSGLTKGITVRFK